MLKTLLDVAGAYPSNGQALNISKETTSKRIVSIEDTEETMARMCTLNISSGRTNAIEVSQHLAGFPGLDAWHDAFEEDLAKQDAAIQVVY